jgi:hypothetical protein
LGSASAGPAKLAPSFEGLWRARCRGEPHRSSMLSNRQFSLLPEVRQHCDIAQRLYVIAF